MRRMGHDCRGDGVPGFRWKPLSCCGSMVDCSRFLEEYSAFRDGELENDVRVDFEMHLELCPACARYDRVIRDGVELYRRCPGLTPSDDFLPRLQHRIFNVDEEMRGPGRTGSGTRTAVTLAIAASLAGLAWIPVLRDAPRTLELPAVAARAPLPPAPVPALMPESGSIFVPAGAPFAGWNGWEPEPLRGDLLFHMAGGFSASESRSFTVRPVLGQ
jgi:hypothetical protein